MWVQRGGRGDLSVLDVVSHVSPAQRRSEWYPLNGHPVVWHLLLADPRAFLQLPGTRSNYLMCSTNGWISLAREQSTKALCIILLSSWKCCASSTNNQDHIQIALEFCLFADDFWCFGGYFLVFRSSGIMSILANLLFLSYPNMKKQEHVNLATLFCEHNIWWQIKQSGCQIEDKQHCCFLVVWEFFVCSFVLCVCDPLKITFFSKSQPFVSSQQEYKEHSRGVVGCLVFLSKSK